MQKSEIIENYLQAGYRIFPVNGKKPAMKAWQNVKQNPFLDVRNFTKNYGICLQSDDLVIDVDIGEKTDGTEKKGKDSFNKLVKLINLDFKKTFGIQTGSGGFHFYFKKPKNIQIKEKWRAFPDLEFKSKGRYVVGAESIHPETNKPYKVVVGQVLNILDAPAALLELIKFVPVNLNTIKGIKKYTDDEQSVTRCRKFLQAAEGAIEGEGGDQQTFIIACRCRGFGLSPQSALDLMLIEWNHKCSPPWDAEELKLKVCNAYLYDNKPLGNKTAEADFKDIPVQEKKVDPNIWGTPIRKDGTRKGHIQNTICYFNVITEIRNLLKYNLFTDEIEFTRFPPWYAPDKPLCSWADNDATDLKYLFAVKQKYDLSIPAVHEGAFIESRRNMYHPLKDYLNSLLWDGKERARKWLSIYAGVEDNAYTQAVGFKILIGAVTRIFEPGCKFDTILVLEGEQGAGKSRLIEALAKDWYADLHLDPHHKDTVACMRNSWIIEVSEMTFIKKAEITAMRSFLSRKVDRFRFSHKRLPEDCPRQSVFIGTINPDEIGYLTDPTGHRRFWPVSVPDGYQIKVEKLEAEVDQVWAEVMHIYRKGSDNVFISDKLIKQMAKAETEKRTPIDEWITVVKHWLENVKVNGEPRRNTTSMEIWTDCLNGVPRHITRLDQVRITRIMKELKWKKGSFTANGKALFGYSKPKLENILD